MRAVMGAPFILALISLVGYMFWDTYKMLTDEEYEYPYDIDRPISFGGDE
jgi:hypothetical protein